MAVAGMLASCSDDDYEKGEVASGSQLMGVTFGTDNIVTEELDPTEPTSYTITVYRSDANAAEALSVPLTVLSNTEDIFTVPASVDFAAGSTEAGVVVSFDEAEIGVSYDLEVALDERYVNPYKETSTTSYALNVTRVKWNPIGTGTWCDGFWYGDIFDVEIYQRDDKPSAYRFTNPYTDEFVTRYVEETGDETDLGTYTPYILLNTTSDDYVWWDGYFNFNTGYPGYGEILAVYDEEELGEECVVVRNDDGGIRYLVVAPSYYIAAIDYAWTTADYCAYLVFPDQRYPDFFYDDEDEGGEEDEADNADAEEEAPVRPFRIRK